MKAGDIWLVNLDPTIGDEIRKTRPVVLVNSGHEKHLQLAIVVPVTSWRPSWEDHPFFLCIDRQPRHGLRKRSAVDCFQVRALSHDRLVRRLGRVTASELDRIKGCLALILDIEAQHCA